MRLQLLLHRDSDEFRESQRASFAPPTCFRAPEYQCQELFFRQALAFVADVGWSQIHVRLRSSPANSSVGGHMTSQTDPRRDSNGECRVVQVNGSRMGLQRFGSFQAPAPQRQQADITSGNRKDLQGRLDSISQRSVAANGWFASNLTRTDTITFDKPTVRSRSSSASADLVFMHVHSPRASAVDQDIHSEEAGQNPRVESVCDVTWSRDLVAMEPRSVEEVLFSVCLSPQSSFFTFICMYHPCLPARRRQGRRK